MKSEENDMQQRENDDLGQHQLVVDGGKQRFDRYLAGQMTGVSRGRLQKLIKEGQVQVNGTSCLNPSHKVNDGDRIFLTIPPLADPEPEGEEIPLEIVFEDDMLIVINKPAGLVVHPGAGNWTGTLVNALIAHCGDSLSGIGGVRRPGIVHRIDKETSGLLVVAKNDLAHRNLARQFADHGRTNDLKRAYTALVWGKPKRPKGRLETDIGRSPQNRLKMAILPEGRGKEAITHYRLLQGFEVKGEEERGLGLSLLECRLETGRTHQIRVHMSHLGHPLVRDPLYGQHYLSREKLLPADIQQLMAGLNRQALHASLLQFTHPGSGEVLHFETPLPADMARLVDRLARAC